MSYEMFSNDIVIFEIAVYEMLIFSDHTFVYKAVVKSPFKMHSFQNLKY